MYEAPTDAVVVDERIATSWTPCRHLDEPDHRHDPTCLWVWHYCHQVLGPETIAPGERFGWRPAGIQAHNLVSVEPITVSPSIYWPECSGLHGFLIDGRWNGV